MDPIRSTAAIPVSTTTTTGSLVVHVRHADDKTPAAGVTMILIPPNTNSRFSGLRQVTDASGTVRFADLAPGPRVVRSDRGFAFDGGDLFPDVFECRHGVAGSDARGARSLSSLFFNSLLVAFVGRDHIRCTPWTTPKRRTRRITSAR